jgi:hypothetical protein
VQQHACGNRAIGPISECYPLHHLISLYFPWLSLSSSCSKEEELDKGLEFLRQACGGQLRHKRDKSQN